MTDDWRTEFSVGEDDFAYASVTHGGETKKYQIGPCREAIGAAMAWVEYNDVREAFDEMTLRDIADFFRYDRQKPGIADEITAVADELYGKEPDELGDDSESQSPRSPRPH